MEKLFDFIGVIQVICAVNFAWIIEKFHATIFNKLFNPNIIEDKFMPIDSNVYADLTSISELLSKFKDRKIKFKDKLVALKKDYEAFKPKWEKAKDSVYGKVARCLEAKCFRSFFLYISLYCICDMILVSCIHAYQNELFILSLCLLNFVTTIISILYIVKIIRQRDKREDNKLYQTALFALLVTIGFWGICLIVNKIYGNFLFDLIEVDAVSKIGSVLSIIIPFIPCVFAALYSLVSIVFIHIIVCFKTRTLKREHKKLRTRKEDLDESYDLFQESDDTELSFE